MHKLVHGTWYSGNTIINNHMLVIVSIIFSHREIISRQLLKM